MGLWAHVYYWKPKFSDKLTLIMMDTKQKDKYKYCLLLKVGPILGGDRVIIKTKVKNHSAPETFFPKQTQCSIKKRNRFIYNS